MEVRAKALGFRGGSRVREGKVFDWPDEEPLADWVEPTKKAPEAKKPKETILGRMGLKASSDDLAE